MTDTAKRIVGPVQLGTASATLYTVPASTTTIVRSIHITNTNATTAYTATLALNAASTTLANHFLSAAAIPATGTYDWSGFLVMAAGDTIQANGSAASQLTITVSAIEVS